jgi:hypothetical protein
MSARRWNCPRCGAGINAPERMRRDDVRRYCLDCSRSTGRLVERVAPALERRRAASKQKQSERAAAERSKQREARSYLGVDMIAEARRMWNLPSMREAHRGRRMPEVQLRRRDGNYNTGHAWRSRIVVTMGGDLASVLATLLHELAHAAAPAASHHDDVWASLFLRAARDRWGREHFPGGVPSTGARYMSDRIARGIREAMSDGPQAD